MFSDEKALTTLAKDNRTLLEKIHDFFKQFIDKLKDIKLKLSKSSAVYATINHDIDYLEQSAQKIRTMLDNVKSKEIVQDVNTKYSKNTLESEYMEAVDNGDEEEAEKALKNYAMQWGAYSLDGKAPLEADELKKQSLTIKEILDSYGYKFDLARRYYSDHEIINEMEENNGVIIAEYKSKGSVHPYFRDYAIDRLKNYNGDSRGNYKLYAKLNNPLVVDAEGRKWNDIRYKSPTEKYIVDEAQYNKGKFQVTDVSVNQPIWIDGTLYFDNAEEAKNALNSYLKSNNKDNKYYKYLNFTRDVAEYASNQGYDGVVFKNIVDYGGEGALSGVADNIIVAFDNKNVKSADTITYDDNGEFIPLSKRFSDKSDIRYSKDTLFSKALTADEIKKYNNAAATGVDNGLRISDNSLLVECENNSKYQYKYVVYDDFEDGQRITDVYAIGKIDTNVEDNVPSQCHNIAKYINYVMEIGYDNEQNIRALYKYFLRDTSYVLSQYNNKTSRFYVIGRGSIENGTNTLDKSIGRRSIGSDTRFSDKQSRNTRLTLDDNIEDVNEAFLSAVKVLQNVYIDDIDLSSDVVTKVENAAKHIQNEVKKSGYRTQKLTGKGSVRSIATELSEKYGNGKVTRSLVTELAELYDYIANSEVVKLLIPVNLST